MKSAIHIGLSLIALALLSSCSSPQAQRDKRIAKHAETFNSWDQKTQDLIREGSIALGFEPDMVRLSWGDPRYIFDRVTESKETVVWKYVDRYAHPNTPRPPDRIPYRYVDKAGNVRYSYRTLPSVPEPTRWEETPRAFVEFIDNKVTAFETLNQKQ